MPDSSLAEYYSNYIKWPLGCSRQNQVEPCICHVLKSLCWVSFQNSRHCEVEFKNILRIWLNHKWTSERKKKKKVDRVFYHQGVYSNQPHMVKNVPVSAELSLKKNNFSSKKNRSHAEHTVYAPPMINEESITLQRWCWHLVCFHESYPLIAAPCKWIGQWIVMCVAQQLMDLRQHVIRYACCWSFFLWFWRGC